MVGGVPRSVNGGENLQEASPVRTESPRNRNRFPVEEGGVSESVNTPLPER